MALDATFKRLNELMTQGSVPGLSRLEEFLRLLDNPEKKLKFIHITGTNGKGSVSKMLYEILLKSGVKTGIFTSPFLKCRNEYFEINHEVIGDSELDMLLDSVLAILEQMKERPTEFEVMTALAFLWFSRKGCELVVLEAGMGGSLDATNVIPAPLLSIIVNTGLDHTNYLGSTLSDIAKHKAGIIKKGSEVLLYPSAEEATEVYKKACNKLSCSYTIPDFNKIELENADLSKGLICSYTTENGFEYRHLKLRFAALYQLRNLALSLEAVEKLKRYFLITAKAVSEALENIVWHGRFEVLGDKPLIIADGSHNVQGIEAFIESKQQYFKDKRLIFVTGVMKDKAYEKMYELLSAHAKEFILVPPDNARALSMNALEEELSKYGLPIEKAASVYDGCMRAVSRAAENDVIVIIGSLYMIKGIPDFTTE